ncbi:MAG: right-handed parallel beta-helix repeat-containing protein [Candidatus Hydrogenedentes bacterium]|nr:right-handed parallel beta-helix repeat-containing protein [Candidatus Hydrogenedentota bacterium]MBI3118010.1 right-handed parallel beta-helix repeat-containing protein [Candidatus Hydrogenedentota bacterium]
MMPILVFNAVTVLSWLATGASPTFFVATNGNDAWSGTLPDPNASGTDGPVASLKQAQTLLRTHALETGLPEGGTVSVRGGTYYLAEPLYISRYESGTEASPMLWQPYRFEPVRLVAGQPLPAPISSEANIQEFDVAPIELPDGASVQLLNNGERMTLARWPNVGDGELPGGGWAFVSAPDEDAPQRGFHCASGQIALWNAPGAQISIWPQYDWFQALAGVARIDADSRTITLAEDLPYEIRPGRRFFIQNVRAELDAPGEWYLDRETGHLFFWPPENAQTETALATVESLFVVDGAHHVAILGFELVGATADAVVVKNAAHCLVARNVITAAAARGVVISGGNNNRVAGNDISHTGRGGIRLEGGDRHSLTPGGHVAENNHIHHTAEVWRTGEPGISVAGVGQRVANNLLHDMPQCAIELSGNDHLIEFNEMHHVCLETGDTGAFYMGRDWSERGNVFRFNSVHDIYGFGLAGEPDEETATYESPHRAWGIYLADAASGTHVESNIVYRVPLGGVVIGGGRDNVVENNIFAECIPALHIDARWDNFPWTLLEKRLEEVNYRHPPYSERYPELLDMQDPHRPVGNRFIRNIVSYQHDDFRGPTVTTAAPETAVAYAVEQIAESTTKIDQNLICHYEKPVRILWREASARTAQLVPWESWRSRGFDRESMISNPQFLDEEQDDYTLVVGGPAFKLGFERIPDQKIGLYQDELRATWPPPKDNRQEGVAPRTLQITLGGQ